MCVLLVEEHTRDNQKKARGVILLFREEGILLSSGERFKIVTFVATYITIFLAIAAIVASSIGTAYANNQDIEQESNIPSIEVDSSQLMFPELILTKKLHVSTEVSNSFNEALSQIAEANVVIERKAEEARIAAEKEAKRKAEEEARRKAEEEKARIAAEAEAKRNDFIQEWGSRLDNYLSGSPLSGYGETFASAAYDYNIDPRFSAAISCIESSKGAYCFRPHNAWGWGNSSWSSWEEAIVAHAKGLASGYGYTVSEAVAKKYCPPTWSSWYSNVSSEMSKI